MASKNQGAKAVRAARNNSQEFTNKKVDPACTDCLNTPPVRAIILYPNLGTPLMIPPDEKYLNFFIAAENSSKEYFEVVKNTTNSFPAPARSGFRYVDKHLRIHAISNKKMKENTDEGRLWNDGKLCGNAFDNVQVWCIGRLSSGTITDIDGNIFANIRERTLEQYGKISAAHTDSNDRAAENVPLVWVYQVRIILASIPNLPKAGAIASLAWMVALPDTYKKQAALSEMSDWEYQDKLIYDFLESQKKNPKKSHFPELYEFSLPNGALGSALPEQVKKASHRLKAWHPFMIGVKKKLVIGHLSDVHINVRQFAMAKSQAQVVEGVRIKLGSRVNITFVALKNIFDEMKKAGADILFITGDLLDFNRNIDPDEVSTDVGDQWDKFNVSKNINNSTLYKRGLDDMLMYSLLRYSYRELKLPVFLTTGNHEAYDIPYGISPRRNKSVDLTGILEMTGDIRSPGSEIPVKSRELPSLLDLTFMPKTAEKIFVKSAAESAKYAHKNLDKNAYSSVKANEGIAADHNLTIYEACLIYGPTYAQALTSQNFLESNFDWFFTLFTPLADYAIAYESQQLIGLDWGGSENYVNLSDLVNPFNADFQGAGILPRACDSITKMQEELLESAFSRPKNDPIRTTLLFSHFTFVNFDMKVPFRKSGKQNIVKHRIGTFGDFNVGTFEKKQDWLHRNCINNNVQYHFSGHSHRSGIYTVADHFVESGGAGSNAKTENLISGLTGNVCELRGFDAGIEPNHPDNKVGKETKLIVSSCGGPIGVQNQDQELFGYNLQLPSGTLLNEDAVPPLKLVKTDTIKVPFSKPRLCVALDYLWIMWRTAGDKEGEVPIDFVHPDPKSFITVPNSMPNFFWVKLGRKVDALKCISKINFYIHINDKFQKISMNYKAFTPGSDFAGQLYFDEKNSAELINSVIQKNIEFSGRTAFPKIFCEVELKKPTGPATRHFNYEDKWYFPVKLVRVDSKSWVLTRPLDHAGEVPDWDWLSRTFSGKYPNKMAV